MELAAHFSETDRRPKNMILRLPYTEQNHLDIQQYDADFDKQKLYTVKVDYTKNIMNLPTKEELNALRDECYKIACEHGWHDEEHSERHLLCLVISELMEAVEADRIDRHADLESLNDAASVYPWVRCFATYVKDTVENELADAAIRILDLAGLQDCDIGEAVTVRLKSADDYILMRAYFKASTFTEAVYTIVENLFFDGYELALLNVFNLSYVMDFDLMEHIRLKMQYNRTRERLHGKKY
jgi:hypothetical protein